ncbi:hypothetical protein A2303_00780 [Candidatus Falkowbacteria bacterium RIFOXYB2_FULL_47_14]|uniref:Uncharacterized protein n=1 Tax=Candidatus Falkowbacteria bacterium RIFOXYA2_FULL_47_19 TaxID=1797994 RepID=A0A1F5SNQ8_9BACT|nr:MAG: hypothetical protein A2227_05860 [Candidatus Falkowbacteria bacterium RIFOXYA2_FULL_47_19]OGF35612.1 MAG: hypothetical protein A2468_06295 [Candidatus Falkowbacteria bacterium RIFOXYC2_FULL_46_15]OGF42904.1 MAG: hypothetical protein A2303_00780 [Candidatus Falkowbacteria bacterium RIFOXYB2_FULL_47_14]
MKKRITKKELSCSRKKLKEAEKEVEGGIRDYCRAQKGLWQRIPWLALMADGRGGFSPTKGRAYREGYWMIFSSGRANGPFCTVEVDCENGELDARLNSDIVKLIDHLDELNAAKIIAELKIETLKPEHVTGDWRDKIIEGYGLEPVYRRNRKKIEYMDEYEKNAWLRAASKQVSEKLSLLRQVIFEDCKKTIK